jgi:hypothetical protein
LTQGTRAKNAFDDEASTIYQSLGGGGGGGGGGGNDDGGEVEGRREDSERGGVAQVDPRLNPS